MTACLVWQAASQVSMVDVLHIDDVLADRSGLSSAVSCDSFSSVFSGGALSLLFLAEMALGSGDCYRWIFSDHIGSKRSFREW